jgi:hypothetical protein
LHAGYVGAYGNTWIETPAMNRLASQSFLLDRALVDSPDLERLYRSYWQGWHAACPPPAEPRPSLAARLRAAGVTTALLGDEPRVLRHPLAADFDELVEIDPPWQPAIAASIEATHFGRCFMEIIDWLQSAAGPFLLWCHLGGLGTTWDAPLLLRQSYCEPGDPPPPESADVPDRMLPAGHDPDELLGVVQSYAGQMSLFDACLDAFFGFLDGLPIAKETLLALVSARGFPLGEHGRVGPCDAALFGELVQVPWMMRFPDAAGAAARSQALTEPSDLWATLLDWWGLGGADASPTAESLLPLVRQGIPLERDRLCIVGHGAQRAIRTPAWYLRAGGQPQLFAKPDDRWEINDVVSRCPDIVEQLQAALTQYELALPATRISQLPRLDGVLLNGLE